MVKQYTVEPPVANGVVAMPIKKVTLELDEIGYPGWKCTLRTNPRAELWDKFLNPAEADNLWDNLSPFILEWNFGDEDGNLLPLPPETKRLDLPIEVSNFIVSKFIEAFNELTGLPKASDSGSEGT